MLKVRENKDMALMRVRRLAQLTLPAEVRRALNVQEGDYLEAEIVKEGVLLKPVAVVERKRAWQRIQKAAGRVRRNEPLAVENNEAEEEAIAADVKAMRKKYA
jgi:AbrB family looped-hinge helix DNA binding protein